MSIVATEISVIHGAPTEKRHIYYRCQDSEGQWHEYGPVITVDQAFDAEVYKSVVAAKMSESLAALEADEILRN